jgi:hypothetical protein
MVFLLSLAACSAGSARAADDGCKPSGGLEFVCGLKNPEDLVAVPGTKWIIASGMAPGVGITLIDSRDGSHSQIYPGPSPAAKHDTMFTECTTPPDAEMYTDQRPEGAPHALSDSPTQCTWSLACAMSSREVPS